MKVLNSDIWNAVQALQLLGNLKLPGIVSYSLAKLQDTLERKSRPIEKTRLGLVEKYGTVLADGKKSVPQVLEIKESEETKLIPNPAFAAFLKEWEEIAEIEVDINFEKVTLPAMVESTCDSCKHIMKKPLELESNILKALVLFVDVA